MEVWLPCQWAEHVLEAHRCEIHNDERTHLQSETNFSPMLMSFLRLIMIVFKDSPSLWCLQHSNVKYLFEKGKYESKDETRASAGKTAANRRDL